MKKLLSAVMLCALGVVGCGEDPVTPPVDNTPKLNTQQGILDYLDGKSLTMTGANIPSHPNGLNEDTNYGQASQCYKSVTMTVSGGTFSVNSVPGTIEGAANVGQTGTCNHDLARSALNFNSTAVLMENIAADGSCFDVTFTYPGFKQVGRGGFSADAKTLRLELFFENAATGAKCANGAVGSNTVSLIVQGQSVPFTGNAVQVYTVSQ
ncbi:MAG TPA: hypothetical protein VE153_29330 [Myxococcus sp.]|nr:hypothetical protein [Myxococcus sp.]